MISLHSSVTPSLSLRAGIGVTLKTCVFLLVFFSALANLHLAITGGRTDSGLNSSLVTHMFRLMGVIVSLKFRVIFSCFRLTKVESCRVISDISSGISVGISFVAALQQFVNVSVFCFLSGNGRRMCFLIVSSACSLFSGLGCSIFRQAID